ncbi:hypothetical protein [Actinoplanes digitatis]|uniref:Uncharacterized protein n=1 Tax=Actinoplanes digitatis TaxID=1868 RepID=A0A7W7I300_9ACTN|nr:hypothetical protein [Actinoplanes digitatis]MBB4765479.1 hypothetical protein [Actinoplanes digitatis]
MLIAAYVSFQIPSTTPAMLTLLPPLAAATPLALPAKARSWAGAAVATMLTGFTFVPGDLGLYYLPVALQLWAATIVPWVLRRGIGRVATRSWHLAAAAVIALPALLLISAFATGKFDIYWAGVALWVAGPLVVAALCAFGIRTGYALTALAGASVMILAVRDQGFLFAAFWLFAAVYLTIGATGFTATRPTTRDEAAQPGVPAQRLGSAP